MKPETRRSKRNKSKRTNPNLTHNKTAANVPNGVPPSNHKSSIVRKIRNVCDKIANSSSNVFDFDSYLLSRLKYLFNTNKHLVDVNKYFHRKKETGSYALPDQSSNPSQESQESQESENSEDMTTTCPDHGQHGPRNNNKNNVKLNTIKSLKDVSKLDDILDKYRRDAKSDSVSEDFIYRLCSYTNNARTVAAQLWHWKVLDCVRRSNVSFHNFFVHTIGAAIRRMSDDEVKCFSKIVRDTGAFDLDEFDNALLTDPSIFCCGDSLRRCLLQILHSYKYLIQQFNQALFSWYTLSMFYSPNV